MIKGIKKDDIVLVCAGDEKGKTGKVMKLEKSKGRVIIEKINMVKKHVKPTQENPKGGITEKEAHIDSSNIQFFCSSCNKGVRLGFKEENGKKTRFCRSCNKSL